MAGSGSRVVSVFVMEMSWTLWFVCWCAVVTEPTYADKHHISPRDIAPPGPADSVGAPRVNHRVAMLFPLLLGISGRLATLIPTALSALFGIFLFVAFSKKAFLISVIALVLTYLDKYKHRQHVVYLPKHELDHDEDYTHHHHHYSASWKKPVIKPFKKPFTLTPSKHFKYPHSYHDPSYHSKNHPELTKTVHYSDLAYSKPPPDSSHYSKQYYEGPYADSVHSSSKYRPSFAPYPPDSYDLEDPRRIGETRKVDRTTEVVPVPSDFNEFIKQNIDDKEKT